MRLFFQFIFFGFASHYVAQQAHKVDFRFQLKNGNKTIEYSDFCKEYQIVGEDNIKNVTPCDDKEIRVKDFYRGKSKLFNAGGKIQYEDLTRKFIHSDDTMVLILVTNLGKNLSFEIEELEIRNGKFAINEPVLKKIDFDKGEEDYYNYILKKFKSLGELTDNFESSYTYIELNRLRDMYLVPLDDYDEKTIDKLRSYRKKTKKKRS